LLWFKKLRRNLVFVFILTIFVNIGMWFERFVIIVTSLHRDYLPSSWAMYSPTWVEIATFVGTFGLFFTCFFLFAKFLPVIAIAEVKTVLKTSGEAYIAKLAAEEAHEAALSGTPATRTNVHNPLLGNDPTANGDSLTPLPSI
jgi:molybdopterin-containing oxidoreductase family membrane subunit